MKNKPKLLKYSICKVTVIFSRAKGCRDDDRNIMLFGSSSSLHGWKTGPLSAQWFIPHRTLFQQKCTCFIQYVYVGIYLFNIWYGIVSFVCSLCLQRFFPRPPASSHSLNTWMLGSFLLSPYDIWNRLQSPPPPVFSFFCDNSLTGEAFRDSDRLIFPDSDPVHILFSMFSWSCVCVVVKLCAFGFVGVRVRVCAHAVVVFVLLRFVWFACLHVWVNARLQVYGMCFALQRVCLLILLRVYSCEWNVCIR